MTLSVIETYRNQKILILGGLGFIGKVLLYLFLEKVPSVGQLYLLLRGGNGATRLDQVLRTSPVFSSFQDRIDWIKRKITVVDGDASLPDLGIRDPDLKTKLREEIALVINSAGLVTFNPDLKDAIDANFKATVYTAKFVQSCRHAKLLHLSTCYVAGNVSGPIPELIREGVAPNGDPFHLDQEMEEIEQALSRGSKQEQLEWGIQRAQKWGWPNIYTYTKAISELWLQEQKLPFTIVRPSIVESSLTFPFPTWNEGFNTTAPLILASQGWSPYVVTRKDHRVDLIPVDILSLQVIKIGALLLNDRHETVYQCATSERNPFLMERLLRLTKNKQRELLKSEKFSLTKWLKALLDFRAISAEHPMSHKQLYAACSKFPRVKFLKKISRNLLRLSKLVDTYLPFLYQNNYIFASTLIDKVSVVEPEFNPDVNQIDWDDYWPNIHIVGINKWCLPKMELHP